PKLFSLVHLLPKGEDRPPAVFGRIKTCYPSDGQVQNIQEFELLLPGKGHAPDRIVLRANDILLTPNKPLQSFCMRLRFLVHPDEVAGLAGQDPLFLQAGFLPEFSTNYIDLLDIHEQNHAALPWFYVMSSRWFASIPTTVQPEIREKLTKLI